MSQLPAQERARSATPWDGRFLDLTRVGAPICVCATDGTLEGLSPQAAELLGRLGIDVQEIPFPLPESLWRPLVTVPAGQAIEWRPEEHPSNALLGCTRYPLGSSHTVVFMREVSDKHAELSRRLHLQRLQCTGRLVASIAHEVRTAVASISYNADFLSSAVGTLSSDDVATTAGEIHSASRRLQTFVDGLLDYAKLGPPVAERVSVETAVNRAMALVRPVYREKEHSLHCNIEADVRSVLGNPLSIEQVIVNLLVNAAEVCDPGGVVEIYACAMPGEGGSRGTVEISVRDNGPGVRASDANLIFEPFFTNRAGGTGLGLTTAREAARECGGDLVLAPRGAAPGARFIASLPEAPENEGT